MKIESITQVISLRIHLMMLVLYGKTTNKDLLISVNNC